MNQHLQPAEAILHFLFKLLTCIFINAKLQLRPSLFFKLGPATLDTSHIKFCSKGNMATYLTLQKVI